MFRNPQAYADRREAGRELAGLLQQYAERDDVLVLALPRGGVPVAFEVAEALNAPLDIFLVRKLGTPGHRELAMGAIASGGIQVPACLPSSPSHSVPGSPAVPRRPSPTLGRPAPRRVLPPAKRSRRR
jgi:hypothetical protein